MKVLIVGDENNVSVTFVPEGKEGGLRFDPIRVAGPIKQVIDAIPGELALVFQKNDVLISNANQVANQVKQAAESKINNATKGKTSAKTDTKSADTKATDSSNKGDKANTKQELPQPSLFGASDQPTGTPEPPAAPAQPEPVNQVDASPADSGPAAVVEPPQVEPAPEQPVAGPTQPLFF